MTTYERIAVGDTHELGSHLFTTEEIRRFADAFDPQVFHTDEAAAKDSLFGGLCASGWHTASAMMRQLVDYFGREIERATARGEPAPRLGPSPGFDDLKWLKPVYPGDRIAFSAIVVGKRPSGSRPGWGIVSMETTGANQKGEPVFAITTHVFVAMTTQPGQ